LAICKAFIAKAVWDFATTGALLDALKHRPALRRLCGWETVVEIPSESVFSRAFAEFARSGLPQRIHEALIKTRLDGKLVGHLSRDAQAIKGREKAKAKKPKEAEIMERVVGETMTGDSLATQTPKELAEERKQETRMERQLKRSLAENVADLPTACDWGCKKNSKGKKETWRGYKIHADTMDGDIPVSFLVTSASMHDSQAAIPLAQMSAERVTSLYDLADAAYDAKPIRAMSARLEHVALIDHNPRRGEKREFNPAEAVRYNQRSSSERLNSHLLEHGGAHVRVRGDVKVAAHLCFGILVIAAEQLPKLLS